MCASFARAFFAAVQRASDYDSPVTTPHAGDGSDTDNVDDVHVRILCSAAVMLCRVYDAMQQQHGDQQRHSDGSHAAHDTRQHDGSDNDDDDDEAMATLRALPAAARRDAMAQMLRVPLSDLHHVATHHTCRRCSSDHGTSSAAAACVCVTSELARVAAQAQARVQARHGGDASCGARTLSLTSLFAQLTPTTRAVLLLAALWLCTKVWSSALQRVSLHRVLYDMMTQQEQQLSSPTASRTTTTTTAARHDDVGCAQASATLDSDDTTSRNNHDNKKNVATTTITAASRVVWLSSPLQLDTAYMTDGASAVTTAANAKAHATRACDVQRECSDNDKHGDCLADEHSTHHNDYNDYDSSMNDSEDVASALVDAVEDAEVVLLRCSQYTVPLLLVS